MQEGKGIRMVYDCIPFFNELDILNLRLHVLDPYVDKFIIEEATVSPRNCVLKRIKRCFVNSYPKSSTLW